MAVGVLRVVWRADRLHLHHGQLHWTVGAVVEEPRPGAARLHIIVDAFHEGQLTVCLKSSKPIQIGLCMLMTLSIHLHSLHLDAQYDQTRHLLTQLRSGERTGRRLLWSTTLLLPTLLSDSQVSISLVVHGLWWTVSGQVMLAYVVLTCTNGVSPNHLPVIVTSDRPWTTVRCVPINKIWRWI